MYPALDSMRLVGALGVLVTHVAFQTGHYGDTVTGTFLARLDSGVAVFFVLSGFLLSRPFFSRMAERRELPRLGFYAWKRILRIVPVYVVTVVLVLALVPTSRGSFWPHWVENLTLTVIYTPRTLPDGLTQMWSLATEVAFYTVLPLFMVIIARLLRGAWSVRLVWLILATLVVSNIAWLATVDLDSDRAVWLPSFVSWFAAGMAIATVSVDVETHPDDQGRPFLAKLAEAPGSCLVTAGAVLLVAATPVAGPVAGVPTGAEAVTKNLLYLVAAVLLIIPGVFSPRTSMVVRGLSWRPLRYLGRISYSIFCIHLLVLYGVFAWRGHDYFTGHFGEILVLTLVGSIAASSLLYSVVEMPFSRLRLLGRPSSEAATTPDTHTITT